MYCQAEEVWCSQDCFNKHKGKNEKFTMIDAVAVQIKKKDVLTWRREQELPLEKKKYFYKNI